MTTMITAARREAVRAALISPNLTLVCGPGDARTPGRGEACTISEIVLTLTGKLDDGPHPCISEVIRCWVIRIQDAMPDEIRNSAAWREAAAGIAGSASTPAAERLRRDLLLTWMWEAFADDSVIAAIPASLLPAWRAMLVEKTCYAAGAAQAAAATYAVYVYGVGVGAAAEVVAEVAAVAVAHADDDYGAYAAAVAVAYAAAIDVDVAVAHADAYVAYWQRRNLPATLAALIAVTAEGEDIA